MFGKKRDFLLLSALIIVFSILGFGFVSAVGVTLTDVNSTYGRLTITDASDLYAYEINFDYTGSAGGIDFSGFLGAGTSTGTSDSGSIYTVYESKLDNTQTGVTGSGELFNVTHDGTLSLRFALFISATGTDETVYYNTTADAGGGGGGGGASAPSEPELSLEEIDISILTSDLTVNLIAGEEGIREIVLKSNTGQDIILDIVVTGEILGLVDTTDKITFDANEEKKIGIGFRVEDRGLVVGKILFLYSGTIIGEVPIVINVRSEDFLFDSSISLLGKYRRVVAGNNLKAQVNLLQVGPQEKVDVTASYVIKDFFGNTYLEESETFFVLGSKDFVKEFFTEDLPPGKYLVGLEIVYPGAFATTSTQFEIVESRFGPILGPILENAGYLIGGIVIVIIVFLVVAIVFLRGIRKPYRKRRKR